VVPCDSPILPTDLAQRLATPLLLDPELDLAWAHCPGRHHYLHALLRTACLGSLPAYLDSGERAVHRWYAQFNGVAVEFADTTGFANLNHVGAQPAHK
jgi:molybdopterin-guanine dinucleotide biosynthesis protein A